MRASRADPAALAPLLERLLADIGEIGGVGEIGELRPLPAGAGGQSFRVTTPRGDRVAKFFDADAPVLLGAAEQAALLDALANRGIAPRPVACDPSARLLVTEFVGDAEPATPAALRRGEGIDALALLLRQLHEVAFPVPPFAPLACAERYLEGLGGPGQLGAVDRARYDELLELAARPLPGRPCLCHNDVIADNLLLGARPRLVDFDYAALATPILDLASAVFMNDLPPGIASHLLETYHDGPPPYSVEEFARVQRLLALLAHFWSLAAGERAAAVVTRYRIRDV
jgi:Ser/Thr protein kinase RdoA (MazF antagonist)